MDIDIHGIGVYMLPIGPLRDECQQCWTRSGKLSACGGCMIVRYCCRAHQVVDRPMHKSVCGMVRKKRAAVAREEHQVRHAKEDWMTPANAFATDVGRFWGLRGTRPYMQARMDLAETLRLLGTRASTVEALEHMVDMLRLCHRDNLGIRDVVPATLLRLDRDQEAYDFVCWWAHDNACDEVWYDTHKNFAGQDVWAAPPADFGLPPLNPLVATLFLKLKLLVDVRNLKVARTLRGTRTGALPPAVADRIEQAAVRSPLALPLQKLAPADLRTKEATLVEHIRMLGARLAKASPDFVQLLFEPDDGLYAAPDTYAVGSWDEAAIAIQYSYNNWAGTEGVLDLVYDAHRCAGGPVSDGSRVWAHIQQAADNAAYLGPDKRRRPKPRPKVPELSFKR